MELTLELQRLKAEYDHYRQRVRRDRLAVREIAVVTVLTGLLPVLDAVEGAREHGDGVPRPVADMLEERLTALGLQSVGAPEQPFDPTVHEALTFHPSDQATQAVCTQVLRRGYRVGEHLLRPALVSVTGPGSQAAGSQVMAARQDAEQEQPMGRPHSLPLTRASAHTRDRLGARPDIGHERQRKGVSHNPCQEGCNGTVQKSGLRLW